MKQREKKTIILMLQSVIGAVLMFGALSIALLFGPEYL